MAHDLPVFSAILHKVLIFAGMRVSFNRLLEVMTAPRQERSKLFRTLAGTPEEVNQPGDFESWTLLHWTAHWGLTRETRWLLRMGANPFLRTERGEMPLEIAAQMGRLSTARALLEVMLWRATQSPHEYKLLKEELADWHFYYKMGWIPWYFISISCQSRGPSPKVWPHWQIVLMVLTAIEEIFAKIQTEEEKDKLLSHRENLFRRWDPLWGLREIIPSPISCLLEGKAPFARRGHMETINLRHSYMEQITWLFFFDLFWKYNEKNIDKCDWTKILDIVIEEIRAMQRLMLSDDPTKYSCERDCRRYIECMKVFSNRIEEILLGQEGAVKDWIGSYSLVNSFGSDDFIWPGADALYLPVEEITLPEEKYRQIRSRIYLINKKSNQKTTAQPFAK